MELNIIQQNIASFENAGVILATNQSRSAKAQQFGEKLLSELRAAGGEMTPELDARMQAFLANCDKAQKEMNESRKPITQTLRAIADAFTSEEAKLDKSRSGTIAYQIQQVRNAYATQLHEAEQKRLREIEQQKAREQELIRLKAEHAAKIASAISEAIIRTKNRIQQSFNEATLETLQEVDQKLRTFDPVLKHTTYSEIQAPVYSAMLAPEEYAATLQAEKEALFPQHAAAYRKELLELALYLIDRVPSKKQELIAVREMELEQLRLQDEAAKADEAERAEIERQRQQLKMEQELAEKERQQREQAEKEKQEQAERERAEAQKQQIEMSKNIDESMTLFNAETETALSVKDKPEMRTGYEIEALVPAAYLAMFQQWFTLEGQTLTLAQLEKKLSFVKKFCEDIAHKDESKKLAGNLLKYKVTATAVNRRAKN